MRWLAARMQHIGLEARTFTHRSNTSAATDIVYSMLRARRGDRKEVLVLVTPLALQGMFYCLNRAMRHISFFLHCSHTNMQT